MSNAVQQLFFDALPKISLAFVTHRAPNGRTMTVCLEKENQEATVFWKQLNMIIRRGTLFLCEYKKVLEDGEHKFVVTKAIEICQTQPVFKYEKIWTALRLFKFTMHTTLVANGTCVKTSYEAKLVIDTDEVRKFGFNSGELLVGWARFEVRNNGMGPTWYLIEVEGTLRDLKEQEAKYDLENPAH